MSFNALGRLLLVMVLASWLRRRSRTKPDPEPGEADRQALLDLLIPHARELLAAQVQDVDELASKALGVLAVDGVALALLVGARGDLSSFW